MEEVDEGFGSNESNHSTFNKETILSDLKYLNGQNVLDKNINGNNLYNGNLLKHASEKDEVTNNDVDLDLKNDKNMSEKSPCIGFANALRDHDNLKNSNVSEQSNSKEEVCESYLRERSLSPTENENSNCSLKDESKAIEQSVKDSPVNEQLSHIDNNESEVTNNCNNSDTEEMVVQTEIDSSSYSNKDSPIELKEKKDTKSFENDYPETSVTENGTDTSCHDKIQTVDRNSQNKTPVKQPTSSAEGERSPFLLDDKVRNSLKGLVAKVKSSELSRESMSPAESSVSGDIDGLASPSQRKLHEDEVSLEEENDKQDFASMDDAGECILEDGEDGISMEIGSENEDELLEMDSELSPSRKCNSENSQNSDIAIKDESVDESSNQKSITNTDVDSEDTISNNAIAIDITSEDDDAIDSEKDLKRLKNDSVERIQFEEDSNSNGNSVKINDIVNFLNHDLSGTNSPLTTSDDNVNGDSKPETVDNEISDTQGSQTENMDNSDVEMIGVIDVDKSEENNTNSKIVVEQTDNKNSIKENEKNEKQLSVSEDKDAIIIDDSNNKELDFICKNVGNDKKDRKNCEGENLNSKAKEDVHSDQINGEEKEKDIDGEVDEVVDDDDDDVIFEGASMPAMRNEYQKLSSDSNVKQPEVNNEESSMNKGHKEEPVVDDDDDDDDVIFEKETKVEVPPKQNCDIANKLSSANAGNKGVLLPSENCLSDAKNANDVTENNSSDKVSVITSRNSSDRKRSAEDKDYTENESKRSKLDLTGLIGKLGSRVEPASIELLSDDSDEEVDKPSVEEKEIEAKSAALDKVEESKLETNERLITVTEKELEELVREKVKTYLTSQRDTLVAKLIQKVKELQQNNDLWKRQVKDLQVKVNDVTVLQQKLEKRKAATAALRQITSRNVAVQVDEGRTSASLVLKQMLAKKLDRESGTPPSSSATNLFLSTTSSKAHKVVTAHQRSMAHVPLVSATGNGTIRLPIQQSQQSLQSHIAPGSKMVSTAYQTPSVKSLLDTTRVQKTVGSITPAPAATVVSTSMIEFIPYTSNIVPKPATATFQGFGQPAVTQISQNSVSKTVAATKTVSVSKNMTPLPSPNTAKVIDLTDDDDSNKARLVTLPAGIGAVSNQPAVRHVLAPPGTQLVRTGLSNQPTYQLVFSSPPGIRPGMMMTVAPALPQTASVLNSVQQSQTMVTLTSPSSIAPGTSLARAAVSATPTVPKAPVNTHPAPFPPLPPKQQVFGLKSLPPKPCLKISRVSQGIVLSWNMVLNDVHAEISNYQLFAYQETSALPVTTLWKKVGDVKALPLPMACTLTQFQVGNKYHFAVRAMDTHNRVGDFSDPGSIHLTPNSSTN